MLHLLACGATLDYRPFYAPDEAGPYDAGAVTLNWTDARGKELVAEVWYPADAPDGDEPDPYSEIPFVGSAYRNVDALPGPWPLVAFSHGNSGIRYQSIFLTEWLATHGFVVVAPDHVHNTLLDYDQDLWAEVMRDRPGDVSAAVDKALEEFPVEGENYVMMGHSFGAWTTLAVAGAEADLPWFRAFCAEHSDYDLCDADPGNAGIPEAPDPRAVAGVSMSPCGWYTFGEHGLDTLTPTLVMGGDKDDICPIDTEVFPTFDRAPTAHLATVHDAGHFVFSNICSLGPIRPECTDPGFVDTPTAQLAIRTLVTAFVQQETWQDARNEPYMHSGAGIDWTTKPGL